MFQRKLFIISFIFFYLGKIKTQRVGTRKDARKTRSRDRESRILHQYQSLNNVYSIFIHSIVAYAYCVKEKTSRAHFWFFLSSYFVDHRAMLIHIYDNALGDESQYLLSSIELKLIYISMHIWLLWLISSILLNVKYLVCSVCVCQLQPSGIMNIFGFLHHPKYTSYFEINQ